MEYAIYHLFTIFFKLFVCVGLEYHKIAINDVFAK